MRDESQVITRRYELDRAAGRAIVIVNLKPCVGREPIMRVRINDVRSWLENKEGVKLGEAIQGGSINNNMSKRLNPDKTYKDLEMTYVFKIIEEQKEKPKPKPKAAPKKTTTRRTKTSAKSTVVKEETVKKPTRRTRTRKTTTASKKTTTKTQGDK